MFWQWKIIIGLFLKKIIFVVIIDATGKKDDFEPMLSDKFNGMTFVKSELRKYLSFTHIYTNIHSTALISK